MSQQQLQQAIQLHQQGSIEEAEQTYLHYLADNPEDPNSHDLLGILYAQQQNYPLALTYFQKALGLTPNNPHYLTHCANVLKKMQQIEAAIDHYQQAITLQPNYAEAYNNLAALYTEQEQYALAIEYYQQAITIKPDYVDAHLNLANIYLQRHEFDKALIHFRETIRIQPNHLLAHKHIGNILYQQENIDAAIESFNNALNIDTQDEEIYINLAACYLKQQHMTRAIDTLNQALELNPGHPIALANLAAVYLSEHKDHLAKPLYYDLLTLYPKDYIANFNMGCILLREKKWQSAACHLQTAVEINPDNPEAQQNFATVLLKVNQAEKAIAHFERCLALQPNNQTVRYTLSALTQTDTPERAPDSYIIELFDHYAEHFDQELIEKLDYQVPQLIHDALVPYINNQSDLHIVDLGCGSGLCGPLLKPYAETLTGIDLSANMLKHAQTKNVYDQLLCAEINTGLQQLQTPIHVMIAADVFVYFGNLQSIINACRENLPSGGLLCFTIEAGNTTGYSLTKTGRYQHALDYIKSIITDTFSLEYQQSVTLRKQQDHAVKGYVFIIKAC